MRGFVLFRRWMTTCGSNSLHLFACLAVLVDGTQRRLLSTDAYRLLVERHTLALVDFDADLGGITNIPSLVKSASSVTAELGR